MSCAHTAGRSSFRTPSRSMRWPPVTLTVGILNLSATSAIARSSSGVVKPPHMRGTTENVPSFWMLACTRSLTKRDCGSSLVVERPGAKEIVVQRRPARRAAAGGLPAELLHHGRNRLRLFRHDEPAHLVMGEVGALAHRLAGCRGIACAERCDQQCLDLRGALTAGGGCLGAAPHVVNRREPAARDRLGDRALADAVAAADFRIVRETRDQRHRIERRAAALIRLTEDQRIVHLGDVRALLQQVEVPGAVGRIAVKHRADDAGCRAAPRACRRRARGRAARSRPSRRLRRSRRRRTGRRRSPSAWSRWPIPCSPQRSRPRAWRRASSPCRRAARPGRSTGRDARRIRRRE